ncbi:energy transducer TonB [Qipengyuania sp. DGS5-3]|uniref:energy transducer TonB n=1 Tax=Qipengyuania sp. DGS5-3 TaxID=3349632 RepID=UPI0036D36A27
MTRFFTIALIAGTFGAPPALAQSADEAAETVANAAAVEAARDSMSVPPAVAVVPSNRDPRPTSSLRRLITVADYPIDAWQNDLEGSVNYQLHIDSEGRVSRCLITRSSGSSSLDQATCELITQRARFEPGLNELGEPVESKYRDDYKWRKRVSDLPDFSVRFSYLHTVEGISTQCEIEVLRGEMPDALKRQIERDKERGRCPALKGRQGVPYRDENRVPIERQVSIVIDTTVTDPEE